jgi:diaminohydroxyphosphoribosylaminopyrimidine deaminase / 5-amino-6-(5-phosphoribosylamino)uracil reductase
MSQHEQDERLMQRALKLAHDTIGQASPNPQVGCVLTQNGEIIAEGAHFYDLRDHAEIAALKQAAERGISTIGATAYVTLEPCAHHGRTGPCADALVSARIARCVIATTDPNPLVSGQGIAKLRAAGIEVTIGTLQQQAQDLNDAFAHFIQHHKPFVTLKAALSADGKLAPSSADRLPNQPHWLTSPAARLEVQLLRHASDAILTGIGTVLADDPALTDRTELPRRRPLLRVILDTHLRTPLNSQLVRSVADNIGWRGPLTSASDLLIFCGSAASNSKAAALGKLGIEVDQIPSHHGRLSLPAVLTALAERDILSLLLEAGSHLNGAFLTQNLVDKAVLFYGESTLGESALPFAHGIESTTQFQQTLHRPTQTTIGPDTMITGYIHNPWPTPG